MAIAAQVLIALIALLHVYFVLLETVLFKTRGRRVFGLSAEKAEIMAPAMSNQGCYNGFLVAALLIGLLHPDPAMARAVRGVRAGLRDRGRHLGRGDGQEDDPVYPGAAGRWLALDPGPLPLSRVRPRFSAASSIF